MKVSVIVPAYRLEHFIVPCLDSLSSQQTSFDYEVLVCNDASPDGTLNAIKSCAKRDARIQILDNTENLGLVGTMQRLLATARGDYIAYLDGDDLALPGKLQAQVDYLDAHPGCGIVYHESEVFDSTTGETLKLYSRDFYNRDYIPPRADATHLVRYGTFLQASSVMIRRHGNLLGALEHGCRIICDYPWHIGNAMLGGGTIDLLDRVLGRYRMHSDSFGAATNRNLDRRLTVTRELEQACQFARRLGMAEADVNAGVAHARFAAALYFLRLGEDDRFVQMAVESAIPGSGYFDSRHAFAHQHRDDPTSVREHLGWKTP
ncbi:glycosyltransferase family 2 protein [Niveibacterium sp.]|uniref:glycosyltransferase family 2 protein n=1 Tax=Niveibacterium sp. TaxID=2017444 RepID=UPI0035AD8065